MSDRLDKSALLRWLRDQIADLRDDDLDDFGVCCAATKLQTLLAVERVVMDEPWEAPL